MRRHLRLVERPADVARRALARSTPTCPITEPIEQEDAVVIPFDEVDRTYRSYPDDPF